MLPQFFISGARKFGNLIVSLFPFLSAPVKRVTTVLESRSRESRAAGLVRKIRSRPRIGAAIKAAEGFYWRNYAKDRVDWSKLSPLEAALLRPPYALSVLLCLLLPVAMALPRPAIPAELIEGATGAIAAWAPLLWAATMSVAWGWMLAGSGRLNRPSFLLVSAVYLYFHPVGLVSAGSGRWYGNAIPSVTVLFAAWLAQRTERTRPRYDLIISLFTILPACVFAGFLSIAATPMARILPGPPFAMRVLVGAVCGATVLILARVRRGEAQAGSLTKRAWSLSALTLITYGAAAIHAGPIVVANALVSQLQLLTGYMWPLWYLIGVGIIHKLLGQTRIMTAALTTLMPSRFLIPSIAILLAAGTAVLWTEFVLASPRLGWPSWLAAVAMRLYSLFMTPIWSSASQATTATTMRWVLLAAVCLFAILAVRRKLDGTVATSVLFKVVLAWLIVSEYNFQIFGFSRSPAHSIFVLSFLAIWAFWLVHQVGFKTAVRDTQGWPRTGRIVLYGGVLAAIVLALQARSIVQGNWVFQEVFFYLLRGVLDVGLPFFLYVYATKRVPHMPVPVSTLLASFATGALLSTPLTLLDKLVRSGSWGRLVADVDRALAALLEGRSTIPDGTSLPLAWIAARTAISLAALILATSLLSRRSRGSPQHDGTFIVVLMAAAAGMASFSKARIELPLVPPRWMLFIEPDRYSLLLDADLLVNYFAYGLPALVYGLLRRSRLVQRAGAFALTWLLHFGLLAGWRHGEPWLRSTGLLVTLGLAAAWLWVILIGRARDRIEAVAGEERTSRAPAGRAWVAVGAAAIVLLVSYQSWRARMIPHELAGVSVPLQRWWVPAAGSADTFLGPGLDFTLPVLKVEVQPLAEQGAAVLLQSLVERATKEMIAFEVYRVERWDRHAAGVVSARFMFESPRAGGGTTPLIGSVCVVPIDPTRALVLTVAHSTQDEDRIWDLAWIARAAAGKR